MKNLKEKKLDQTIADLAKTRPFFGICLGLQLAVIEYARHVVGLEQATSLEFDADATDPVIHLMHTQQHIKNLGGSMRLGSYPCTLIENSLAHRIYQNTEIHERHRHRYEVNLEYIERLEKHGLTFSGQSPDGQLIEMIEVLEDHDDVQEVFANFDLPDEVLNELQ